MQIQGHTQRAGVKVWKLRSIVVFNLILFYVHCFVHMHVCVRASDALELEL